jgi:EAL domain-containing protein (putative c-di-GMP-specific phosphodiesterase class I)
VKIDRSLTASIGAPESDARLHALVKLGRELGLRTLAEGVETPAQIDHLRREGVDEVQGFMLSRPLRPNTLAAQGLLLPRTDQHVVIESA